MGKYSNETLTANNENYELKLVPVAKNSSYQYEQDNSVVFYGRPANNKEKRNYRIQAGVHGSNESVYIVSSSLPEKIKPGDRVYFLGEKKLVESVGYYFNQNMIVNSAIFDPEYIIAKCPKGISLQ